VSLALNDPFLEFSTIILEFNSPPKMISEDSQAGLVKWLLIAVLGSQASKVKEEYWESSFA